MFWSGRTNVLLLDRVYNLLAFYFIAVGVADDHLPGHLVTRLNYFLVVSMYIINNLGLMV